MALTPEQYQRWLNNGVTREVFATLEQAARPAQIHQNVTEENASYVLGFITGFWQALDTARHLVPANPGDPEPTYQGDKLA